MKRSLGLLALLGGLLTTTLAQQKPAAESDTLRINTALVTLSVGITDKQGQPLTNLKQADFVLYEDGQLQELDFFGAEDQPISFGLLIDRSQSMGDTGKLENAKAVLQAFLRAGNPQNEAFCLAFNETAGVVMDFTSEYARMAKPLSRLWAEGGTAFYDALNAGLEHLQRGKHRRRALIVVTDGGDQHSRLRLDALLKRVQQSNTQIYIIGFFSSLEAAAYQTDDKKIELMGGQFVDNPRLVFKTLAAETGAETFFPKNAAELADTITRIAASLRRQYTLAYYPANQERDDRYRRLEVRVRNVSPPQIKTRQGYRLTEPFDPAAEVGSSTETASTKPAETAVFTLTPREPAETPVPPLYRETFDQPSSQWPQTEKTYVKKGKYYVHGAAVIPLPPFQYKDFELTVNAALAGEVLPPGSIGATELSVMGLSFRVNPHGYYELSLAPFPGRHMGMFTLSKVANGQSTILRRADREPVIGLSNQIKVRCRGPQIELFINGLLVASLKDETHQAGAISLLFNGKAATFDDLTIRRLD
ncbi:MAG: VWA domain-containing protein [Acidobacteria bacterium]|nr:VWA domain-containing protein [Acidobacteriota bacterium]MBI3426444.1 VWA domain-containing protein [Acidobacteriota bacterium]